MQSVSKIVVIAGPPRSGTTMLQHMLCNEKTYPFLPECSYITAFIDQYHKILLYDPRNSRFKAYYHSEEEMLATFRSITDTMLTRCVASFEPKDILVIKDPVLSLFLEYVRPFFAEKTRLMIIVRDPRDVIASMKSVRKRQGQKWDIRAACIEIFNFYFRIHKFVESVEGAKACVVRYEDVATNHAPTLQKLEAYCGYKLNSGNNNQERHDKNDPFYSDVYGKEVTESRIGMYKSLLSLLEKLRIELRFRKFLRYWNYR